MRNRTNLIFIVVSLLFVAGSLYLSNQVTQSTKAYKLSMEEYAATLSFQSRMFDIKEWLQGDEIAKPKLDKANKIAQVANTSFDRAVHYAGIFAGAAVVYLLVIFLASRNNHRSIHFMSFAVIITALLCLYAGVSAPMLEIASFQRDLNVPLEIPFIKINTTFKGDLYFYYQSKSVLELISLLFEFKNYIVAISILLFSVAIPFAKLSVSVMALLYKDLIRNRVVYFIIHKIGKWSMADVFVAACFLAYLSFNNMSTGIQTQSRSLPGLYFFFAYVILSLVSAYLVNAALKRQRLPEPK